MNFLFSFHDETIFDKFAHEDSGVCLSNLLDFVGIHPYSFAATLKDFGG